MSQYNHQYYIVFENYDDDTLYLTTHDRSDHRNYEYTKLVGSEPMFFTNGYRDEDLAKGISRPIKQAHLSSTYPVITNEIKNALRGIENELFQFYPAVILDDNDTYNEDYWVFNVFHKMDVLDIDNCAIRRINPNREGQKIQKYFLSDNKLDKIPLSERLVFKPKFSNISHIIVHETVVNIFQKHDVDTLNFIKISDWEMGLHFIE
ncbi:imm11 family protein [Vibrio proteolyticus]|uniref:Immunity MXAN-0049 protein domain-containing protein n=2 Tax=Vibrio proteolyticus TaxID=671 RepID=U3A5D2_VIBPR|nr:hypothetical protein VPR01S_17_00010 [Vibrio proteolyticus NBRC 13287]